MKRLLIMPILMVLGALALAYLLLPRERELAFMQFKAGHTKAARSSLERRLERGERSISDVSSLSEVYFSQGHVDRAVELLESLAAENPYDRDVQDRLAYLYDQAMRPGDYLSNLTQRYLLDPDEEKLRELESLYVLDDRTDDLLLVRQILVESQSGDDEDLLRLARQFAARGQLPEAVEALKLRTVSGIAGADEPGTALLLSLLLDLDRDDEAVAGALESLGDGQEPDRIEAYVRRFVEFDGLEAARRFLAELDDGRDRSEAWRLHHVGMLLKVGQIREARDLLEDAAAAGGVSAQGAPAYLEAALAAGRPRLAFDHLDAWGVGGLPLELIPTLLSHAKAHGRHDLCEKIRAEARPDVSDRPLLAARLAWDAGDAPGARRHLAELASQGVRPAKQILDHVLLLIEMGGVEQAEAVFRELDPAAVPADSFEDLAGCYVALGRAEDGYRALAPRHGPGASAPVTSGWIVLSAATGRIALVEGWLAEQSSLEPEIGAVLVEAALRSEAPALACRGAERLHRESPDARNRLLLAETYTAAGRGDEALGHLQALLDLGHDEAKAPYLLALQQSGRKEELRDRLLDDIAADVVPADRMDDYLSLLVEVGAGDLLMEEYEARARKHGGAWLYAYDEAARTSSSGAAFSAFLVNEFKRGDLSDEEMIERFRLLEARVPRTAVEEARGAAYAAPDAWGEVYADALERLPASDADRRGYARHRLAAGLKDDAERRAVADALLRAGDVEGAVDIYRGLAAAGGPGSADTRQLLHLWGPRPGPDALAWCAERAGRSPEGERTAWLRHLLDLGGSDQVAALLAAEAPADEDAELQFLHVLALERTDDAQALAVALPKAIAAAGDTAVLRRLAWTAVERQFDAEARSAWERLLRLEPSDHQALLWLGGDALTERRWEEAERRARPGVAHHPESIAMHALMAEVLTETRRTDESAEHYEKVLALVAGLEAPSRTDSLTAAGALARLGRNEEAEMVYERLSATDPGDPTVRAEYASFLLATGRHARVREILGEGGRD